MRWRRGWILQQLQQSTALTKWNDSIQCKPASLTAYLGYSSQSERVKQQITVVEFFAPNSRVQQTCQNDLPSQCRHAFQWISSKRQDSMCHPHRNCVQNEHMQQLQPHVTHMLLLYNTQAAFTHSVRSQVLRKIKACTCTDLTTWLISDAR